VAKLAAISPTTHHLFFSQTSQLPASAPPPCAAEWVHKVEACRQSLTQARPDVLVMIGSDRIHQLWLYNMPQFLVSKAPLSPSRHQHLTLPGGTP
jgi:protocatechuate 4,5-dioxygenase beta chain